LKIDQRVNFNNLLSASVSGIFVLLLDFFRWCSASIEFFAFLDIIILSHAHTWYCFRTFNQLMPYTNALKWVGVICILGRAICTAFGMGDSKKYLDSLLLPKYCILSLTELFVITATLKFNKMAIVPWNSFFTIATNRPWFQSFERFQSPPLARAQKPRIF